MLSAIDRALDLSVINNKTIVLLTDPESDSGRHSLARTCRRPRDLDLEVIDNETVVLHTDPNIIIIFALGPDSLGYTIQTLLPAAPLTLGEFLRGRVLSQIL
ncbi:Hypothetical protein D9617_1g088150 [Elsinoe fawcettii]|nr:Hypothetical protein D9617_1g088150 [Elsinoe fawcettii]